MKSYVYIDIRYIILVSDLKSLVFFVLCADQQHFFFFFNIISKPSATKNYKSCLVLFVLCNYALSGY